MNNHTFPDKPALSDSLGAQKYVKGLSDFIKTCDTPMAISIRGTWGTGKTSLLEQIRSNLDPKPADNKFDKDRPCKTMWFNTWQFSQSGYEQNMTEALLDAFQYELKKFADEDDDENKILSKTLSESEKSLKTLKKSRKLNWVTAGLSTAGIFNPLFSEFADILNAVVAAIANNTDIKAIENNSLPKDDELSISSILETKDNIQKSVKAVVPGEDQRLVVFIDDLDRLTPTVAVSLLEGIKVFLDCEKTIFVMAIDDEVVYRGINEKYGLKDDSERGRMFFDKIIQIPFRIPVEQYDYSDYISTFLKGNKNGNETELKEEVGRYVAIINAFPQTESDNTFEKAHNPRTIKRAFNLQQLNKSIYEIDIQDQSGKLDDEQLRYMFAKHLIEIVDEVLFKKLISANIAYLKTLCLEYPLLTAVLDMKRPHDENSDEEDVKLDDAEVEESMRRFLEIVKFNTSNLYIPKEIESIHSFIELLYKEGDIVNISLLDKGKFDIHSKLDKTLIASGGPNYNQEKNGISVKILMKGEFGRAVDRHISKKKDLYMEINSVSIYRDKNKLAYFSNYADNEEKKNYNFVRLNEVSEELQEELANCILESLKSK